MIIHLATPTPQKHYQHQVQFYDCHGAPLPRSQQPAAAVSVSVGRQLLDQ